MADLEAVAAAALGSPLVAGLSGGRLGEIATYLPGHRVLGVRDVDGTIEVHVVARWGPPLTEVGDVVRAAVTPYADGSPVAVFVEDIELPEEVAGAAS